MFIHYQLNRYLRVFIYLYSNIQCRLATAPSVLHVNICKFFILILYFCTLWWHYICGICHKSQICSVYYIADAICCKYSQFMRKKVLYFENKDLYWMHVDFFHGAVDFSILIGLKKVLKFFFDSSSSRALSCFYFLSI